MPKKRINSNQKGKRGEREVRDFLRDIEFPSARRAQQYDGLGRSDVIADDDLPFVHIEAKFWDKFSSTKLLAACSQAEYDCPENHKWVVIWRCTGDIKAKKTWRMTFVENGRMFTATSPTVCRSQLIRFNALAEVEVNRAKSNR